MKRLSALTLSIPLLLVLALVSSACTGSPSVSTSGDIAPGNGAGKALAQVDQGAGHEAETSSIPPGSVIVTVEAGEFYINSSVTTFKVGVPYHFELTNVGKIPHEVMLMPVVEASSGMDMEEIDKMALAMVEEEDFLAGDTGSFDVIFTKPYAAGELELACHVSGHYESGMFTPITVTAS